MKVLEFQNLTQVDFDALKDRIDVDMVSVILDNNLAPLAIGQYQLQAAGGGGGGGAPSNGTYVTTENNLIDLPNSTNLGGLGSDGSKNLLFSSITTGVSTLSASPVTANTVLTMNGSNALTGVALTANALVYVDNTQGLVSGFDYNSQGTDFSMTAETGVMQLNADAVFIGTASDFSASIAINTVQGIILATLDLPIAAISPDIKLWGGIGTGFLNVKDTEIIINSQLTPTKVYGNTVLIALEETPSVKPEISLSDSETSIRNFDTGNMVFASTGATRTLTVSSENEVNVIGTELVHLAMVTNENYVDITPDLLTVTTQAADSDLILHGKRSVGLDAEEGTLNVSAALNINLTSDQYIVCTSQRFTASLGVGQSLISITPSAYNLTAQGTLGDTMTISSTGYNQVKSLNGQLDLTAGTDINVLATGALLASGLSAQLNSTSGNGVSVDATTLSIAANSTATDALFIESGGNTTLTVGDDFTTSVTGDVSMTSGGTFEVGTTSLNNHLVISPTAIVLSAAANNATITASSHGVALFRSTNNTASLTGQTGATMTATTGAALVTASAAGASLVGQTSAAVTATTGAATLTASSGTATVSGSGITTLQSTGAGAVITGQTSAAVTATTGAATLTASSGTATVSASGVSTLQSTAAGAAVTGNTSAAVTATTGAATLTASSGTATVSASSTATLQSTAAGTAITGQTSAAMTATTGNATVTASSGNATLTSSTTSTVSGTTVQLSSTGATNINATGNIPLVTLANFSVNASGNSNITTLGSINFNGGTGVFPNIIAANTGTALVQTAGNQMVLLTSSERFKENIVDSTIDSSKIYDLVAKEFNYKQAVNPDQVRTFGWIAEEAFVVLPELVNLDADGQPFSINYGNTVVLIVEEMKKLKQRIATLEAA